MHINSYQLFFQIFDQSLDNIHQYTHGFDGCEITQSNIDAIVYEDTYACNQNDQQLDEFSPTLLPIIVVWLGERDCVKYNSLKIVSKRDLHMMVQKDVPSNKEVQAPKYQAKSRKYKQSKRKCSPQRNHLSNLAKNYYNIDDVLVDYHLLRKKSAREFQQMKIRQDWDCFENRVSYKSNGWKDNTRAKRQYLKHH